MNRTAVSSSNIRSVGYEAANQTLEIEFHSGGVYQYGRVPTTVYQSLMRSASKGSFFHDHIKENYRYRQVR